MVDREPRERIDYNAKLQTRNQGSMHFNAEGLEGYYQAQGSTNKSYFYLSAWRDEILPSVGPNPTETDLLEAWKKANPKHVSLDPAIPVDREKLAQTFGRERGYIENLGYLKRTSRDRAPLKVYQKRDADLSRYKIDAQTSEGANNGRAEAQAFVDAEISKTSEEIELLNSKLHQLLSLKDLLAQTP